MPVVFRAAVETSHEVAISLEVERAVAASSDPVNSRMNREALLIGKVSSRMPMAIDKRCLNVRVKGSKLPAICSRAVKTSRTKTARIGKTMLMINTGIATGTATAIPALPL